MSAPPEAVWLRDLALADRLADAAVRAGGGPESSFIRAYVLSSLSRGEEADAVLANVVASDLTDIDRARLTWLEARRHPGWRYLDHELAIAQAWLSASQGAVSEAVRATLSAAQTARANGQFAAEVMCLQTATQSGDSSSAGRLHQLCQIVEGPRARLAARFADAMQAGNAAELTAVSEAFQQTGDLIAAAEAAAHAALAYRSQNLKGASLTSSARADELARQCGGVVTPALQKASERSPLTDREREIVMLIGRGQSTRAIAERLTLSVRTIEGHVYRAMMKTGAGDREELAKMLPRW